ncbi:tissue factor pathway inhibitor 2-like [Rhipicephalus microplus]|uniref:tissue factor pathway inhibitor 2-like n=1 Tax=Rhipicephalus microplus TaxID=6941 RepID=UPI002376A402
MSGQDSSEREKSPGRNSGSPRGHRVSKDKIQAEKEGDRNPCFLCMGTCFLLTVLLVVLAAAVVHFIRPQVALSGKEKDSPICNAPLVLTACDNETERYYFHYDPDKLLCLARYQLDPGCLDGKNRFTSAAECRKKCITGSSGKYGLPAECAEPVKAAPCTDGEIRQREHPYFFDSGNCTLQTGAKCLYGPNRFRSADECRETCLDVEEPACRVPRFQGSCRLIDKRFTHYYDRSLSACISWRTACLGGPNRHESSSACVKTCVRSFLENMLLQ